MNKTPNYEGLVEAINTRIDELTKHMETADLARKDMDLAVGARDSWGRAYHEFKASRTELITLRRIHIMGFAPAKSIEEMEFYGRA